MRATLALLVLSATLVGCATTAAPPMSDPTPPAASCDHTRAQSLIGQAATPANVERARQLAGARMARVLKPGQMVTMEFIEGRLNVYVDANNVITQIRCG